MISSTSTGSGVKAGSVGGVSDERFYQKVARWYEKFAEVAQQLAAAYAYSGLFLELPQRSLCVLFTRLQPPAGNAHLAAMRTIVVGTFHQHDSPVTLLRKQIEQDCALALLHCHGQCFAHARPSHGRHKELGFFARKIPGQPTLSVFR